MRRRRLVLLLAVSISGCNSDRIARLETENRELAAKLDVAKKAAALDGQERCAQQALRQFQTLGYDRKKVGDLAEFTNHYSVKLNRCFMEIQTTSGFQRGHKFVPIENRIVLDAFEGNALAAYSWRNEGDKQYWEVAPYSCRVTGLNGEVTFCKSTAEFEQLIKQYMGQ